MTTASKIWFWGFKWLGNRLVYGVVIIIGYVLFPLAYFFRYKLKVDLLKVFMNDETDYGEQWWRDREGITKNNFWVAYRWYARNPAWNFNNIFIPKYGPIRDLEVTTTVEGRDYEIDWADKEHKKFGKMVAHYTVLGTTYGRYSFAQRKGLIREIQAGAGGNRYRGRLKMSKWAYVIIFFIIMLFFWRTVFRIVEFIF